ncbi:MAG: glycosyltransferase [Aureispira sp.]|nr:glycosyltransferase [Aureispira sp.]
MKLSVIIVNYNVQYFLEQTLLSVRKAAQKVSTEVFVVDNNSVDESVEMVREKFPEVKLIVNRENTGFSKANNQAIRVAQGEYVLLLNPDTVVREDTFEKTVAFMDAHPKAGGLGVKMIDGKGKFLPESKRGFPSPEAAFYKAFGLSKFFPKSKRFNRYHLGYLDKNETHEIDVLSGAFMLMRKSVLDEVGYLDEAFFMYGEDIDLSYRIVKAGYKNYYFADTTIIHYKGESTKKGSLNYVKTFYNAMIIFTQKHFGDGKGAGLFITMLRFAIYFRAILTLITGWGKRLYLPILDGTAIFGGMVVIKNVWEIIRFDDPFYYDVDTTLLSFNFPFYICMWLFVIYMRGGYDRQARLKHLITGIVMGTVFISAIYAFFPIALRSSRMLILLGALWALVATISIRGIINWLKKGSFFWYEQKQHNLVIVGDLEESQRVLHLLYQVHADINFIGTVSPYEDEELTDFLGGLHQLDEIVHVYKVEEMIFCAKDISSERIIHWMTRLGPEVNYKIVPEHSESIIGSNSKDTAGDFYTIEISFNIASSIQRRNKRILDIIVALGALVLLPFLILVMHQKLGLLSNIIKVLLGYKTWVGYHPRTIADDSLPTLKPSVLSPVDGLNFMPTGDLTIKRLNLFYAKDYGTNSDIDILWKGLRHLGRQQISINTKNTTQVVSTQHEQRG